MNQTGYDMECNRSGISDLTLRKLCPAWQGNDQVVTEYRTIQGTNVNALMVWGTRAGTGMCDLYIVYSNGTIMVLAETGINHA